MVGNKLTALTAALALSIFAACGSGNSRACVGSDCLQNGDAGFNPTGQTGCKTDTDCGGGICQADGSCSDSYTPTVQSNNCTPNPCDPATQFCANGQCFAKASQCRPADPACIYVPHGSFEQPARAFWWPWTTPDGPDDKTGSPHPRLDLEYKDYVHVMSTPVVIRLHKADPAPAIVFNSISKVGIPAGASFIEYQAVMRAVSGVDGTPIWTAPRDFLNNQQDSVNGNSSITAGDCKGDGEVCFITGGWNPDDVNFCDSDTGNCHVTGTACTAAKPCDGSQSHRHGGLIAFGADGRTLWKNRQPQVWWGSPAIARLLGPTGPAQIVVGNGVYDGATGATLCPQTGSDVGGNGDGTLTIVADIDLDGIPEIITGNNAYKLVKDATSPTGYSCPALFGAGVKVGVNKVCGGGAGRFCGEGFAAVANFAGYGAAMGLSPTDPHPQIVVVSHGYLRIHDWTGGMILDPIPLPSEPTCPDANQGGAPTIADFDGDGLPEIGIAGQGGYLVWKPGVNFVWRSQTRDCSSNTGSSVFDFEGKGEAKVVYGDQCFMRIYDGKTGSTLIQEKNSSCTAYEMPIVADTDGSGRAKIVIPSNTLCSYTCDWGGGPEDQYFSNVYGVKVLSSPTDKWVNTRSVWNQHSYHVTNVNIDGTLPYPEPNSWAPGQSNSYRQNVQGRGVFSAPDLTACEVKADLTDCHKGKATATVTVYNGGALVVKAGVDVAVYAEGAAGTKLVASAKTSKALQPGDSEQIKVDWAAPSPSAPVKLRAVLDEKGLVGDCHPENNVVESEMLSCPSIG